MTIRLPQEADSFARSQAAAAGFGDDVAAYLTSLVLAKATPSMSAPSVDSNEPSAYDVAEQLGLIGCIKNGPADLSTNPKHMEGFGRDHENGSR